MVSGVSWFYKLIFSNKDFLMGKSMENPVPNPKTTAEAQEKFGRADPLCMAQLLRVQRSLWIFRASVRHGRAPRGLGCGMFGMFLAAYHGI
jgi:hypothetical protein